MKSDFGQVEWNEQLSDDCRQIVRLAVREDLDRYCDWTTVSLVPAGASASATIVARDKGIISGLRVAQTALDEMQADIRLTLAKQDGDSVFPKETVASLEGSARDILTTERILLNLIGRLSGIATLTGEFVERIKHTRAKIYDTRKTTPGWRRLEKHAVHTGGAYNHRIGLFAAVMIKDNHLALSEDHDLTPTAAIKKTKKFIQDAAQEQPELLDMIIEVEVDTVDQFKQVLAAKPDIVLLDNMTCDDLQHCVEYRDQFAQDIQLEASGGVTLQTVTKIAETGVDRISVGALTHSAINFDVGLDWL